MSWPWSQEKAKFGEKPTCCICSSEKVYTFDHWKCYCFRHRPKDYKDKIGKYSGPTKRMKGAYEHEGEE